MSEHEFAAGQVFFRSGDASDRAYLLQAGQVELLTGADLATRVGLFGPGEVFGEMALIEERPRVLTARALTAGRAVPMSRDEFEHELLHYPTRARQYLRSLFERLRGLTARLREIEAVPAADSAPPVRDREPMRSGPCELPAGVGTRSRWIVIVYPHTPKAAQALPEGGLLVTRFPLRIGRANAANEPVELYLNDLWLLDVKPYNISRNHCEIDADGEGVIVRDRGSHLGCLVNDEPIGGQAVVGYRRLVPGDNVIVIGSRASPFQFRVAVGPG